MSIATLAEDQASSVARERVSAPLPSVRALAFSVSVICHAGIACFAYSHASAPLRAAPAPNRTVVEITVASSIEPDPVAEPPPVHETRSAAPQPLVVAHAASGSATANMQHLAAVSTATMPALRLDSAEPSAPRFIMQAPVVIAGSNAPSAMTAEGSGLASAHELTFAEGQVDSPAKLQTGTPPTYTAAAEAAGVEVELPLELVIDRTGAVQSARTLEHVGYGLDEAAVAAVRRYRFNPAQRGGQAVSVRMRWVLRFQLR